MTRTHLLRSSLLLASLALLGADPSSAQEAAPRSKPYLEVVDVGVVNVDVVVTNRSGEQIPGLAQEDFVLRVDGEATEITNFYAESGGDVQEIAAPIEERTHDREFVPLDEAPSSERRSHIVILLDHTRLQAANRKRAFNALREVLRGFDEDDLISVIGVESSLVVYSDFLFDRSAISDILDEAQRVGIRPGPLEMERRQIFGELARGMSGGITSRGAYAARNEHSIIPRIRGYAQQEYARSLTSLRQIEAVTSTMGGVPGRKVLIYVGEGIPTRPGEGLYVEYRNRFGDGSDLGLGLPHSSFNTNYQQEIGNFDLTSAIDHLALAANRVGVTLYAVDAEGDHGGAIRSALTEQGAWSETVSTVAENFRAPLEAITQATGGRLLRSSGMLVEQLADVVRDFDTFYSLGFSLPAAWEPGSIHSIDLELREKRRGVTLRHRTQVRLPRDGEREASATVAALMYQTVENSLEIGAKVGSEAPRDDGTAALPVNLEIPVRNLTLVPQGEVYAISLSIYVSVKDKDGNPGKVQKIPFHLNIPSDQIDEARQHAAHYVLPLVIRPGDQQAAIVVRDDTSGTLSATRLDLGQTSLSF